jgi:hypothetical protein
MVIGKGKIKVQGASHNKRFHTSGGTTRPTLCVEQLLPALVQAVAIPPPDRQAAFSLYAIGRALP